MMLAWQQAGSPGAPAVVSVHGWAAAGDLWQETGWAARVAAAGCALYVPDLPGHGASAAVGLPAGVEPAGWTAAAMLDDLSGLGVGAFGVVGHSEGGVVAAHLAVRAPERVTRLALVGCDDRVPFPHGAEVAAGLRDAGARVWSPDVASAVGRARRDRRHDLVTLAAWAERMTWPAAPRLGALRTPVLLGVGAHDPQRERLPRLAALFHDARVVTAPGAGPEALAALVDPVVTFLRETA